MDDAHDAEPEQSPYVRLPWGVVAAGLAGVLLIALAAGLFANRYLRPQLTVQPTPILAMPVGTPIPPVAAPPGPTRSPAPTSMPALVPTETRAPAPQLSATSVGSTPTAVLTTGTIEPSSPLTTTPTASAPPTFNPIAAAQVEKAYENYWQVRAQALSELDKSHLDEVMAGDHLDTVSRLIDELGSEKRAIKTTVDHDFRVVQLVGDAAQVFDAYISDSVYVDPVTQQPLSDPTSDELHIIFRLSRVDGRWKVVDSVHTD